MAQSQKPRSVKAGQVVEFELTPNAERMATINRWYVEQGTSVEQHVCLLNIAITADGRLVSRGIGIEPEHALALLAEIDAVRAQLAEFAYKAPAPGPHSARVIPLPMNSR